MKSMTIFFEEKFCAYVAFVIIIFTKHLPVLVANEFEQLKNRIVS